MFWPGEFHGLSPWSRKQLDMNEWLTSLQSPYKHKVLRSLMLPFSCCKVDWYKGFSKIINPLRRRQWQPTPVLLPGKSHGRRSLVGYSPWDQEESWLSDFTFTFHFHALEKEMATHSSILAWRISRTEEPGGLLSMGSYRVGHIWSDLAAAAGSNVIENVNGTTINDY